jgi:hypothetical protein
MSVALWLDDGLFHLLQHPPERHSVSLKEAVRSSGTLGKTFTIQYKNPKKTTILRTQSAAVPSVSYLC